MVVLVCMAQPAQELVQQVLTVLHQLQELLAKEIRRESVRPMGIELDDEDEDEGASTKKKKKKKRAVESPVTQVLFSTFIVQ